MYLNPGLQNWDAALPGGSAPRPPPHPDDRLMEPSGQPLRPEKEPVGRGRRGETCVPKTGQAARGQKGCSERGERPGVLGPGEGPSGLIRPESRGPAFCGPHSPCHVLLRGWCCDLEGTGLDGPLPSTLPGVTDSNRGAASLGSPTSTKEPEGARALPTGMCQPQTRCHLRTSALTSPSEAWGPAAPLTVRLSPQVWRHARALQTLGHIQAVGAAPAHSRGHPSPLPTATPWLGTGSRGR